MSSSGAAGGHPNNKSPPPSAGGEMRGMTSSRELSPVDGEHDFIQDELLLTSRTAADLKQRRRWIDYLLVAGLVIFATGILLDFCLDTGVCFHKKSALPRRDDVLSGKKPEKETTTATGALNKEPTARDNSQGKKGSASASAKSPQNTELPTVQRTNDKGETVTQQQLDHDFASDANYPLTVPLTCGKSQFLPCLWIQNGGRRGKKKFLSGSDDTTGAVEFPALEPSDKTTLKLEFVILNDDTPSDIAATEDWKDHGFLTSAPFPTKPEVENFYLENHYYASDDMELSSTLVQGKNAAQKPLKNSNLQQTHLGGGGSSSSSSSFSAASFIQIDEKEEPLPSAASVLEKRRSVAELLVEDKSDYDHDDLSFSKLLEVGTSTGGGGQQPAPQQEHVLLHSTAGEGTSAAGTTNPGSREVADLMSGKSSSSFAQSRAAVGVADRSQEEEVHPVMTVATTLAEDGTATLDDSSVQNFEQRFLASALQRQEMKEQKILTEGTQHGVVLQLPAENNNNLAPRSRLASTFLQQSNKRNKENKFNDKVSMGNKNQMKPGLPTGSSSKIAMASLCNGQPAMFLDSDDEFRDALGHTDINQMDNSAVKEILDELAFIAGQKGWSACMYIAEDDFECTDDVHPHRIRSYLESTMLITGVVFSAYLYDYSGPSFSAEEKDKVVAAEKKSILAKAGSVAFVMQNQNKLADIADDGLPVKSFLYKTRKDLDLSSRFNLGWFYVLWPDADNPEFYQACERAGRNLAAITIKYHKTVAKYPHLIPLSTLRLQFPEHVRSNEKAVSATFKGFLVQLKNHYPESLTAKVPAPKRVEVRTVTEVHGDNAEDSSAGKRLSEAELYEKAVRKVLELDSIDSASNAFLQPAGAAGGRSSASSAAHHLGDEEGTSSGEAGDAAAVRTGHESVTQLGDTAFTNSGDGSRYAEASEEPDTIEPASDEAVLGSSSPAKEEREKKDSVTSYSERPLGKRSHRHR
ncbi:unnamed protein product [Amoebophrya sp. A120]|nr:unnamed protein product [Amoebophrya sp. A120]|eukprot:GSA120T00013941001.1